MPAPLIKPTDKPLHQYQLTLREFRDASVHYESATRAAFQRLLEDTARRRHWQLVPELPITLAAGKTIRPDGAITSDPNYIFNLVHRILTVSLETLRLIRQLPPLFV